MNFEDWTLAVTFDVGSQFCEVLQRDTCPPRYRMSAKCPTQVSNTNTTSNMECLRISVITLNLENVQ